MRELSHSKSKWDETISQVHKCKWRVICTDFASAVEETKFDIPMMVACSSEPAELVVFCDASKTNYEFCAYIKRNGKSNLLFAKSKLAPEPSKTLPSLELFSVYMALKCLSSMINSVNFFFQLSNITFMLDSQVALNLILFEKVNAKNIFVKNRIKEISELKESFAQSNLKLNFEFVPTEFNIADILTKPISTGQFKSKSVSWLKGPVWILKDQKHWPKGNLGCLPEFRNCHEVSSVVCPILDHDTLIPIQNYSSYSKTP